MADINARTRLLVGTTADWAAHNLVIGDGELVAERAGAQLKLKIGDGSSGYAALPFVTATAIIPPEYLTDAEANAAYLKLSEVSVNPAANLVPRMGANGKVAYGMLPLPPYTNISAGSGDAGKLVALAFNGKIDPSMVTVTVGGHKGAIDATAAVPAGTYIPGDYFINTTAGALHASWGPAGGTAIAAGQQLIYNGSAWDLVGTGAAYLPLSGGTLQGPGNLVVMGALGIGTSNPGAILGVNGVARIINGADSGELYANGNGFGIEAKNGKPVQIVAGGGIRQTFDAAGNAGFGIQVPSQRLHAYSVGATNTALRLENDVGSTFLVQLSDGGGEVSATAANAYFRIQTAGAVRAHFDNIGRAGFGVLPYAWSAAFKTIDLANKGLGLVGGNNTGSVAVDAYFDGAAWRYKDGALGVTTLDMSDGNFHFKTALPGVAGQPINFVEQFVIAGASGRVGIGVSNPQRKLDVSQVIRLSNGPDSADIYSNVQGFGIQANNNKPILFWTGDVSRAQIDAAGVFTYGGLEVGYRDLPTSASTSGDISTVDRGKIIRVNGTVIINPGYGYPQGMIVSLVNTTASNQTINASDWGVTLRWGTLSGNRVLLPYATATLWFDSANVVYITGGLA